MNPDQQVAQAMAALEQFVVDNDDLLAIESLIGRFNIFDAVGIVRAEIRHSNFLAFILDPMESHGQGQLFLKAILMDLLKQAPDSRPLSPIDLDGTVLRGVQVEREWKNIDLLIICQEPAFAIVIENKVDSREHSNQLNRYRQTMTDHYPNLRALYIYLTPNRDLPSEPGYVPYGYTDIYRVLTRVRKTYHNAIGEDVRIFLDHYLTLIGTRFMDNPEIDKLCQQIYKNHRYALDLIFQRVDASGSAALAAAKEVLDQDVRWHVFYTTGNHIDFVPAAWLEWLPRLGLDYEDDRRSWIVLRLRLSDGKLYFYGEVRRMEDAALRRNIIELLIAEGPRFGLKRQQAREVTPKYTRVFSRELVSAWNDDEPDPDAIRADVKKKLDELYPNLEGIPLVLKPLLSRLTSAS